MCIADSIIGSIILTKTFWFLALFIIFIALIIFKIPKIRKNEFGKIDLFKTFGKSIVVLGGLLLSFGIGEVVNYKYNNDFKKVYY